MPIVGRLLPMSEYEIERSHPECHTPHGHVCQEPSGRACIESGCNAAAGTRWGPYWCPTHDAERLDNITASLEAIAGAGDE